MAVVDLSAYDGLHIGGICGDGYHNPSHDRRAHFVCHGNRKRGLGLIVVCGLALAAPATARGGVSCPMTIAVTQQLAAPASGWTETSDEVLPTDLAGLGVFDGPPEERVQLVHDDERQASDSITLTWNLPANPRGHWIVCRYANTKVTLTRRLPDTATGCRIVFDRHVGFAPGMPVVQSMDCGPGEP